MAGTGPLRKAPPLGALMAILALLLQFAIPPGFMAAATDHGPAIVICTGHGPLLEQNGDHGLPGKSPSSKTGGLCPFAGHGGPSIAPTVPALERASFAVFSVPLRSRPDSWPGRGLAAPPPPSRGPPYVLI